MIRFVVHGLAKPAGSKRAFVLRGGANAGRAIVTDANPNSRDWKNAVADAASRAYSGPLLDGPLQVHFRFYRPRPRGHFNSKGALNKKGTASLYPVSAPDVLKLARGVEDAMQGVIYFNDARIVSEVIEKRWGEPARVEIEITPL